VARHAIKQTRFGHCEAIGCAELCTKGELFCERHAAMLQSDIKTILAKHYRPGHKPTSIFSLTLERAKEEVLFCQTAGYRMPRAVEFEW
jgi:hypothetical protein